MIDHDKYVREAIHKEQTDAVVYLLNLLQRNYLKAPGVSWFDWNGELAVCFVYNIPGKILRLNILSDGRIRLEFESKATHEQNKIEVYRDIEQFASEWSSFIKPCFDAMMW